MVSGLFTRGRKTRLRQSIRLGARLDPICADSLDLDGKVILVTGGTGSFGAGSSKPCWRTPIRAS
jgi:hypothetical protein